MCRLLQVSEVSKITKEYVNLEPPPRSFTIITRHLTRSAEVKIPIDLNTFLDAHKTKSRNSGEENS